LNKHFAKDDMHVTNNLLKGTHSITCHQGNTNENDKEMPLKNETYPLEQLKLRRWTMPSVDNVTEQLEFSYIAGRNAQW
jgi:hypothetical protein